MWGDQGPQQRNRGGSRELTLGIEHVTGATVEEQGRHQGADTRD
ncbi:MAG: hypothetical protein ACK559_26280 [bacterium]